MQGSGMKENLFSLQIFIAINALRASAIDLSSQKII